jgi:hypothetical protein
MLLIYPPPGRRCSTKTFSPLKLPKPSGSTPFETTKARGARFDAPFQVKIRPGYNFWLQVVSNSITFSHTVQKLKTGNTETQIATGCSQKRISFPFEESRLKVRRWWVKMYMSHNLQKEKTWRYFRSLNVLIPNIILLFLRSNTPKSGPGHFIFEVSISHSRARTNTHTHTHTHTHAHTHTPSKTPLNERSARFMGSYLHNRHNRRTSMFSTGFKPAIPAIQRLQTYALDRTATKIPMLLQLFQDSDVSKTPRKRSNFTSRVRSSGT